MKATQREPYVALAHAPNEYSGLCNFCVYQVGSGGSPCYEDGGDSECIHPLDAIKYGPAEYGDPYDCWGFRPQYSLQMTADLVGILLRQEFPELWLTGRKATSEQVQEHERLVAEGRLTPWKFGDKTRRWSEDDEWDLIRWLREGGVAQ